MADYEIKNGWILCKLSVCDLKTKEMGIDAPTEWVKHAVKISEIVNFRDCGDDDEYAGCSTIYATADSSFTITVPFDDLCKIVLEL